MPVMAALPVIFVPGIITPAQERYGAVLTVLADEVAAVVKNLEVYRRGASPEHSVVDEVAGVLQAADAAGADRFHYVGYSAGAAIRLAVAAQHPDRLLSLVVDEPPTDWSAEDLGGPWWQRMHAALDVPAADVMRTFARLQVADDVELPPPAGPPPSWMADRPAGIAAFDRAVQAAPDWAVEWHAYRGPVLWAGGDRSATHYFDVRDRLASALPHLRSKVFTDTHHLASAAVLRPEEYAQELRSLWAC